MEQTAYFEKKIGLTPKDLNKVSTTPIETILLKKASELLEEKCSEHGFVLPGSIRMISRSMGYFEPARFTGDAVYYVKLEGRVLYPADGIRLKGEVVRKNKMGLYVVHRNAIRIQVPRDLHIGNEEYEATQVGDTVEVELKRSKFQVNDPYILASGLFIGSEKSDGLVTILDTVESPSTNEEGIIGQEEKQDEDEDESEDEDEDEGEGEDEGEDEDEEQEETQE